MNADLNEFAAGYAKNNSGKIEEILLRAGFIKDQRYRGQ